MATLLLVDDEPSIRHAFQRAFRPPAIDVLVDMVTASRHAHWLNPEPKHLWGSGDSAVPRYQEVIAMHECRSAKQLAAVIDQLLPV